MFFPTTFWTVIRKAKEKEPENLNALIDRYREPVIRFIRYKGYSSEDAEDLTQEVFIAVCNDKFLEKLDQKKGKFRSILCAVTMNMIRMFERDRGRLKRGGGRPMASVEGEEDQTGIGAVLSGHAPTPEQRFTVEWIQILLGRALDRLKTEGGKLGAAHHEAFVLHRTDGLSYAQIAAKLGLKESDVTNYIHAAKKKLRDFIDEEIRGYCSSEEEYRQEVAELLELAGSVTPEDRTDA